MANIQYLKKTSFLLALLLGGFFLKEVFIISLLPIFKGQDEARHYNTIQFLNEPKEKNWKMIEQYIDNEKNDGQYEKYNFSDEIRETSRSINIGYLTGQINKLPFEENSYLGKNEEKINQKIWEPYNKLYPPDITGGVKLYHDLGFLIEHFFEKESILIRFYSIRIFSALLGTLAVLFAYLIAKNIGFSQKESLILTAIFSFQPKFSTYLSNINYDALLIPLFLLFILGSILSLKNGLGWKNGFIMLASSLLGFFTKGTGIVLIAAFLAIIFFHFYKKFKTRGRKLNYKLIIISVIILFAALFYSGFDFISILPYDKDLLNTFFSLTEYLSKSLSKIVSSSKNYWGNLDWTRNDYSENFIQLIWIGELLSVVGFGLLLAAKRKLDFLPEKKYIIFLFSMLVALQLGIRTYDWRVYIYTGKLLLGTPGRYFLPTLFPHLLLIFIGLGLLFKKRHYFENTLLVGLILMFSFSLYVIFNILLPVFYL